LAACRVLGQRLVETFVHLILYVHVCTCAIHMYVCYMCAHVCKCALCKHRGPFDHSFFGCAVLYIMQVRRVPCSERGFQCGRVCGRPLGCGRHKCSRVCHDGPCGTCPSQGLRTCPCGKQEYQGLPCTESPQVCGNTCDKLLPCGLHHCPDRYVPSSH
jgi:NF-X1-type zinc finger protein NFXL1